jgi:hypothetical protein
MDRWVCIAGKRIGIKKFEKWKDKVGRKKGVLEK